MKERTDALSPVSAKGPESARMSLLYDYYGGLLGERQSHVFSLYHEEDLSLAEVAEIVGVTRQGVHDLLKRAEAALAEYEEKLGLVGRHEAWLATLDKIDPNVARMIEREVDI
ncbi:MAG: UPF0175 family protein [Clostridiales Family XIII bacterium]|jgi:predicted DNA-binding protein YlxM (UPF0122 family)|nr:UPF0175 family protein [Clostridiales Family XIII bacterium]